MKFVLVKDKDKAHERRRARLLVEENRQKHAKKQIYAAALGISIISIVELLAGFLVLR